MATRMLNRLSVPACRNAKAGMNADGGGLYLKVTQTGSSSWIFRYRFDGNRHDVGLGPFPTVSLGQARTKAAEARSWLTERPKRDPARIWRQQEAQAKLDTERPAFGIYALSYVDSIEQGFSNPKHRAQWRSTLITYCQPIWNLELAEIGTAEVRRCIDPIWMTKAETARRVRGRIERVLDAARVEGLREGENPARWRGNLALIMPENRKRGEANHFSAMPWVELPAYYESLRQSDSTGRLALAFLILTAARSGEVRLMTWNEVDFESRVWTVPPGRMKARREHTVPLTAAALSILTDMNEVRRGDLVFPGQRSSKPMSDMTLTQVLRREKLPFTVHGFRSSFRDWAGDATEYPRELAEQALAHFIGNQTEAAYRRSTALERRRGLMESWADFLTSRVDGKVVKLHG